MLANLHLALFGVTSVVVLALLALAVADIVRDRLHRLWIDRLILAGMAGVGLTSLVGPALLVSGEHPGDSLHFLYAAVALLALPVGRAASGSLHAARTRGAAIAFAAVLLLGVLLRLYMTGPGA